MNDEELLELESLLESPEFIDDLTEDHFHQLAGVYHRGQMAKITKKILEDLNAQHDLSEKAIKSHKDYPLYRHHADEAVRHHNACSEETIVEMHGVFDSETGHCHATYSDPEEAKKDAKERNKTRTKKGEYYADKLSDEDLKEEIVEMPDDKERFTKMMSPKLDDVLRSASKALAGKILTREEQLRGTFND